LITPKSPQPDNYIKSQFGATVLHESYQKNSPLNLGEDDVLRQYSELVRRIACHMKARMPASVQLEDLIQAGMIGLLEASRKYDASRGASFETYAGIRIKGSIVDELRRGDWAPRSVHRNARQIADAINTIEAEKGRDASDREVAMALGMELDEYFTAMQDALSCRLFSLDELTGDDELQLEGGGSPFEGVQEAAFQKYLAGEIERLPERERLVLALYYDEELNLKEIGEVLGVSESRVSQIHSQATLRLRSRMQEWNGNLQ